MALPLITAHGAHDFHVHAILGLVVILHFLYRVALTVKTGDAFPNRSGFDVVLVLAHAGLPAMSLRLPLPRKRNMDKPMIWPEFRLHSLAFSTRHVAATAALLLLPKTTSSSPASDAWMQFAVCVAIAHATMVAASIISEKVGNPEERTTNAMPYDTDCVPAEQITRMKKFYAVAQFGATAFVMTGNPTLAFLPLSGIQSAPFMMTLVRKGKCGAPTYHFVYAWCLLLPVICAQSIPSLSPGSRSSAQTWVATTTGILAYLLRVKCRLPKHLCWLLAPILGWTILPILEVAAGEASPVAVGKIQNAIEALTVLSFVPGILNNPHILLRPTASSPKWVADHGITFGFVIIISAAQNAMWTLKLKLLAICTIGAVKAGALAFEAVSSRIKGKPPCLAKKSGNETSNADSISSLAPMPNVSPTPATAVTSVASVAA